MSSLAPKAGSASSRGRRAERNDATRDLAAAPGPFRNDVAAGGLRNHSGRPVAVGAAGQQEFLRDQYQADDASCRGYASSQAGSPNDAAAAAGVGSAVAGTIIGAAIGGLIGGGEGAAVGAGMGLFTGSAVGVSNAQAAGYGTQQFYDNAYYQCMYGLGNRVPAPAGYRVAVGHACCRRAQWAAAQCGDSAARRSAAQPLVVERSAAECGHAAARHAAALPPAALRRPAGDPATRVSSRSRRTPASPVMSHKHANLLREIFHDPVNTNIHWREMNRC